MLIARYAKMIMSLSLAAFCLLITFDNLTDYGTNYLAVPCAEHGHDLPRQR